MDINAMSPATGRIIKEDGSVVNLVNLLNTGSVTPVSNTVYDINQYSPRSGRILGEDGKAYNLVDLLANGGGTNGGGGNTGGGDNGGSGSAVTYPEMRIEVTANDELTIYAGSAVPLPDGSIYVFKKNVVLAKQALLLVMCFPLGRIIIFSFAKRIPYRLCFPLTMTFQPGLTKPTPAK